VEFPFLNKDSPTLVDTLIGQVEHGYSVFSDRQLVHMIPDNPGVPPVTTRWLLDAAERHQPTLLAQARCIYLPSGSAMPALPR
jgi:hypothetical protein